MQPLVGGELELVDLRPQPPAAEELNALGEEKTREVDVDGPVNRRRHGGAGGKDAPSIGDPRLLAPHTDLVNLPRFCGGRSSARGFNALATKPAPHNEWSASQV